MLYPCGGRSDTMGGENEEIDGMLLRFLNVLKLARPKSERNRSRSHYFWIGVGADGVESPKIRT